MAKFRPNFSTSNPIETLELMPISRLTELHCMDNYCHKMPMSGLRPNTSLTVILFLLVAWDGFVEAQLTKLKVGYSAISEVDLPAWVSKETRIFEKNGLDVQLIYFTGGTTAVLALVSGEVPISQVAGPAVVNSTLAGSDVVMIAGGATSLDYWLMSRSEIKRPEQLKGGSVAISNFGAASDFVARYALEKMVWVPGKDVTFLQAGGISDRLAAVLWGRVKATVLNPPASFIGQKKGLNILAD